jgi:hypothetical protein
MYARKYLASHHILLADNVDALQQRHVLGQHVGKVDQAGTVAGLSAEQDDLCISNDYFSEIHGHKRTTFRGEHHI